MAGTIGDNKFWKAMGLLEELSAKRITIMDRDSLFQAPGKIPGPLMVLVLSSCLSEKLTREDIQRILEVYKAEIIVAGYLFSAFKESRGQALRDPLEHHFVLKMTRFLGQVGPGRASPHATCKALNRYLAGKFSTWRGELNTRTTGIACYILLPDEAHVLAEQVRHLLHACRRRMENQPGRLRGNNRTGRSVPFAS